MIRALRTTGLGLFLVLVILGSISYTRVGAPTRVYAAANTNINFQARILNSTGGLIPDGPISVQFNLYNVSAGGLSLWTETQGTVSIKNGYMSVALGSVAAFPGTINWYDELWLTMNVNGDGEMSPRIKLTAVPLALRANQANGITNGAGVLGAGDLAQLAPTTPQVINSALAALRLNQTGAGLLAQFQGNGTDVFTIDKTGATTVSGAVLAKNAADSTTAFRVQDLAGNNFISVNTSGAILSLGNTGIASTLQVGNSTGAVSQTINIGNNATASSQTLLNLGSTIGTSSTLIQGGSAGVQITSTGNVTIGSTDATGTLLVVDVKNTSGDPAGTDGAIYYNSNLGKFRCYQNGAWIDCVGSGLSGSSNASASLVSGLANVAANQNGLAVEPLIFTSATAVSNTAGVTGFTAPANGSFRSCLVKNNANITAGTLSLRWRVNGVSTGAAACDMDNSVANRRQATTAIDSNVVTFTAGDTIGIAFDTSAGFLPTATNDFTVYWVVEYNSTSGSGITLQYAYENSSSPARITTTDSKNLEVVLADTASDANMFVDIATGSTGRFAVQNNGTDVLAVTSTGITLSAATSITSGSLNLSSGGITNTGSIAGATTINASGLVTSVGLTAGSGLIQGTGGLTITGTTNINATGSADTNLATGTGSVAIGNATGTLSLTSNGGLNVTTAGVVTGVSTLNASGLVTSLGLTAGAGLIQNTAGITSTGTISLNNNASTNTTNIGTGTTTGQITIGGGSTPLVIDSTNFDVSSSGALSGITTIGLSGAISGATATNTINGLIINSGALSGISTLSTSGIATLGSVGLASNDTVLCRNGTNQVALCSSTFATTSNAFLQNGNSFGTQAVLGTIDANNLAFKTSNVNKLILDTSGNIQFQQASTISAIDGAGIGNNLTFQAGSSTSGSSSGGALYLRGGNGTGLTTGGLVSITAGNAPLIGGDVNLLAGNATGAAFPGNVSINAGTGTASSKGNITIGTTNAALVHIGNATDNTAISLISGTGTINIGDGAQARTVNFGTGAAAQTINIGSNAANTGQITIGGGSSPLVIDSNNFDVSSAGALSGITTIGLSGAITGATSVNTINGLVINSGALSSVTTLGLSGAITGATATNTINGLVINSGALSGITGITFTSGSLNLSSGGITNTGSIAGATTINASGLVTSVGLTAGSGLIQGTGGLTITGTTNINATGSADTNLATGTGSVAIGNATGTLSLTSNGGLNVTTAGAVTGVSTLNASGLVTSLGLTAGAGLIQNTAGITSTGTISLNNNASANTTNIGTGTTAGQITIGGGSTPLVIDSTNFDVSTAGAVSGITGFTQASGNFIVNGNGTFGTNAGLVSLNGSTTIATGKTLSVLGATTISPAGNSELGLTINGTSGTAATALVIAQAGNAANATLTNTARTSGALVSLTHSTSAFSGTGLLLNFANGSGSFASGNFADFQVNSVSRFKVDNTGALSINSDSTSALRITSTAGIQYLGVNVAGNQVTIGNSDTTGVQFVIDTKTDTGDPLTGVNGGMYYNSNANKFRCYENSEWEDCSPGAVNTQLVSGLDTSVAATNLAAITLNCVSDPSLRAMVNFSNVNMLRWIGKIGGNITNANRIRLQYHTGGNIAVATGDAGWTTLDTSAGTHTLNTYFYTAQITIPAPAQINNLVIRACAYDGNGIADPTITGLQLNAYR